MESHQHVHFLTKSLNISLKSKLFNDVDNKSKRQVRKKIEARSSSSREDLIMARI